MISIPKLREVLKFPPDQDGELESLRDAVVNLFETRTSRSWSRQVDHVETKRILTEARFIYLGDLRPLESVSRIEERDALSSTWSVLDASSYIVEVGKSASIEKISGYWASNVRITYTGGYTWDTTIVGAYITPANLTKALETQALFMVNRFGAEKIALKFQTFDGTVASLEEADLHPFFESIVKVYARKF